MCVTHLLHSGSKCNQCRWVQGNAYLHIVSQKASLRWECRSQSLGTGRKHCVRKRAGLFMKCFKWWCVFFFSKSASSNSYFGLKSLPALRDNGTVLSVLNTNYHYIYSCIRGFLCFSEPSSRTSHETGKITKKNLELTWNTSTIYLQPIIRVQHALFV